MGNPASLLYQFAVFQRNNFRSGKEIEDRRGNVP